VKREKPFSWVHAPRGAGCQHQKNAWFSKFSKGVVCKFGATKKWAPPAYPRWVAVNGANDGVPVISRSFRTPKTHFKLESVGFTICATPQMLTPVRVDITMLLLKRR
jgi:hypothetical protein